MAQSVLVIDDSADIHRLLVVRLKDEEIALLRAMNGEEGIEMAKRLKPDLVLLDIAMPGLGGFDVCKTLKEDAETTSIPIIFLTGASDSVNKVKGLDLGAVDYIIKPFDVAELRARVRAALRTARYQKLLEQQAMLDGLTGLWNRAHFDRRLVEVLASCARHDRSACLVMLDIDHFKRVNDSFGHPFGDRVISFVGETLRSAVRMTDIPCRYGGEEFALILPDTDLDGGIVVAEQLRANIAARTWRQRDETFCITASLGVACSDGTQNDAGAILVHSADRALYDAKAGGRNCVRVSDSDETIRAPSLSGTVLAASDTF